MREFFKKAGHWRETARKDRAPPFAKVIGELGRKEFVFGWFGDFARVDVGTEKFFEEDFVHIRAMLLLAPDVSREVEVAQKAARDYAEKLK